MIKWPLLLAPLPLIVAPGCASPPGGFDSPVPAERLRAVTDAARTEDQATVPELIQMLESDDPLVRMASIRTLERITGLSHGYDHAAPEHERQEAVARWVQWYRTQHASSGHAAF